MAGGVEYQVTKVDPTDPETKGMVHQVHKVSEEIAATIGGKVYRARIINDPTAPTVAGKVYQIVLIDDPDDPSVKGMVYNAILTGGSEAVVVGPAVSPLSLPDAIADSLTYVKAFGGTGQNGTPTPTVPVDIVSNNGALKATRPSGLPAGYTALEYIVFDSTQVIDTGFTPDNDSRIESKCYRTGEDCWFYGASPSNPRITLYHSRTGTCRWGYQSRSNVGFVADTEYTIIEDKNGLNINGVDNPWTAGDASDFTCDRSLTIGNNNGSTGTRYFAGNFYYMKIYDNGVLARDFVPCKNASNVVGLYDRVNGVFYTDTGLVAGPNAVDPITLTVVGTTETIATKADGEIISSATAEMLLSVGDYTDEQEIISGAITRNVGIKVLDGTEDGWGKTNNSFGNTALFADKKREKSTVFCSHFQYDAGSTSTILDGCVGCASTSTNTYFRNDTLSTVEDWTQYLVDQYAAGTPVIVVYPLATPTTESVTGQTLQVQDGDNTLEITQASLTGLELEARYEAAVTLSVQEAEDANLDDNVTVTIE